jgi:hypothetical protein
LADQEAQWFGAWIELGMAWYVGFASVWLLSIVLLCVTLKWPVPLLVVPNIAILFMGAFANAIGFGKDTNENILNISIPVKGAIYGWLMQLPADLRTDGYEQKMMIIMAGLFALIFLFSFIFIALSTHHYHGLRKVMRARNRVF